jgi:hypothetical protein
MSEMRKSCCKGSLLRRAKKEPGRGRALRFDVCVRQKRRASELVAQSGTGDIDCGPGVKIVAAGRVENVDPAEVVVQPFGPQEPAITTGPKLPFKSHPCHPTEQVCVVCACRELGEFKFRFHLRISRSMSDMGPADASGAVEEPVGHYQIAKPPASRSQPVDLRL